MFLAVGFNPRKKDTDNKNIVKYTFSFALPRRAKEKDTEAINTGGNKADFVRDPIKFLASSMIWSRALVKAAPFRFYAVSICSFFFALLIKTKYNKASIAPKKITETALIKTGS